MTKKLFLAVAALSVMIASGCKHEVEVPARAGTLVEALADSLWNHSQWISAADAPVVEGPVEGTNERAADGASWFVALVPNEGKVVKARWMTTGLGTYDLYVNGRVVGEEILKPGFTHARKTKYSFTYDITDVVNRGKGEENTFAAEVTPGWWADKIVTPGRHDGMVGRKPAFRGVIELTYDDGSVGYLGTNTTDWRAGVAGPVKHAAIFDGEEYDARELPGYATPELLSTPEVNTEFEGHIFPTSGAEVYFRDDLALVPEKAYIWKDITGATDDEYGTVAITREFAPGEEITLNPSETLVVDFGQNCAGVPEFEFRAPAGTHLAFLPSELLNDGNGAKSRGMDGPEGSVHRRNLRMHDNAIRLYYTFADADGFVTYRPRHTFFGYRYGSITADGGPVTIKAIRTIPVTSISRDMETGSISTGNADVNQLISNIVWGQRSNYLSVPTDCPQRNERLGWTADTQVFAETGSFFANTDTFFHKWMRDLRDSQAENGGSPGVAPTAQYGEDMTRLGWADAIVIVPWVVWKQYADTAIVNENWESMNRFYDHVAAVKYDHNALKGDNYDYQWADWLSYEPLESHLEDTFMTYPDGHRGPSPEALGYWNYLSASYWLMDAMMLRDMARATGRATSKYDAGIADSRAYILEKFLNPDGTFKTAVLNSMQTPALFALRNNLLDGEAKDNMIGRLRKNFKEHDNCLQTGFLGTSILMPTLSENGMSDIAYELLLQRKNPSWLYSIDNGATTIWERWNSYMLDKGMGPSDMNSFNHYAYGCVAEWMWKTMAGIAADPASPGFSRIIMKPVPDRRLGHVDAVYNSAAGPIESHWRYEGDEWIWTFSVPEGAVAEVTLPGETGSKEYASGTHTLTQKL